MRAGFGRSFVATATVLLAIIGTSIAPLQAAVISVDLTTTNTGSINLPSGGNTFGYSAFAVDYLIVAGGGGGGSTASNTGRRGGGGGAGGLLSGNTSISGIQAITVGAGGTGGVQNGVRGVNGGNSTAFSLTAIGGGGGASAFSQAAGSGGSGGGAYGASNSQPGGSGTLGQGNAGGGPTNNGSGGGGAGGAAVTGANVGGAGLSSSLTGSPVTYAKGGDAGGGSGGQVSATPAPAAANTGNGGNGITPNATSGGINGQAGGSGIVVVRYTGPQVLTGGTVSTVGGDTVHRFLSTGNSTMGFNATIAGDIDGSGDMTWDGLGTLTLMGSNSYTGTTNVSAGSELVLNGSHTGGGTYTVASGATIGGTGSTSSSIAFDGSSFLSIVDVNDPLVVANSGNTFGAGFGIDNLLDVSWDTLDLSTPYTVLSSSQDFSTAGLDNFGFANRVAVGSTGREAYFTNGSLAFIVVPEPSSLAVVGLAGLLTMIRLRRNR